MEDSSPEIPLRIRQVVQRKMLAWFRDHARSLPWRGTRDLYRIWISEIMLQQTQVATVIDYFTRFVQRFPDVTSLAAAAESEVLRYWEGLGYYRRARQLHRAAIVIRDQHGGRFPESFAEVFALPGIGRYTAGAILSIGRDQQLPILEANTIRLLGRWLACEQPLHTTAAQRVLWNVAEQLLPDRETGMFNQSLMELGSLVCTPRDPACADCPLQDTCRAARSGRQNSLPLAKPRTQYEDVQQTALILRRADGRLLLRCHPADERWSGLWDFIRIDESPDQPDEFIAAVQKISGQKISSWEPVRTLRHGVTRFRITLSIVAAHVARVSRAFPANVEFRWFSPDELRSLPMNTTGRKIAGGIAELTPESF